jgi:N-formylglutamate amidohydrolase
MVQAGYMDEGPPWRYDARRAALLEHLLERLVVALSEWRP